MRRGIFVTGNGTDVGKSVVSAILVEALSADYWKPVQAGIESSDSDWIRSVVSKERLIHPERFRLSKPMSPHAAAQIDGVRVELSSFSMPQTNKMLIVEGAGGLLVPLNEEELMVDLIKQFKLPALVVSKNYLGSINHTLLTIEALERRDIPILGLVFNGPEVKSSEEAILAFSKLKLLGRVSQEPEFSRDQVRRYASEFRESLKEFLL